jgi:DNA (cytosine-5)-methyltransferase 1
MSDLIVAAFAGPGGMCLGARLAGHTGAMVGIDHDMAACRTAVAAGYLRIRADVATYPLAHLDGKVDGLTLTPPCPTFSNAGHGAGRHLIALLCTAMTRTMRGGNVVARTRREAAVILRPVAMAKLPKATRTQRNAWVRRMAVMSVLAIEPARWVRDIRPRWVALEQVPAVLPLWRHFAALLREHGYAAWAGKLDAECYGVPQTRDRAILVARNDGVRVGPPEPTHQAYVSGKAPVTEPDLFGDPLPPPVSMAEALGWGLPVRPSWTVTAGGTETGGAEVFADAKARAHLRDVVLRTGNNSMVTGRTGSRRGDGDVQPYERSIDAPAPTLDTNVGGKWRVAMRSNYGTGGDAQNRGERTPDEPAPTVTGKVGRNMWVRQTERQPNGGNRPAEAPSLTITASLDNGNMRWTTKRPATTVCGDSRIAPPGHRDREGGEPQFGEGTVRVTVEQAAILQSFPADYPWTGTKSQQYRMVGDAVPPLLAAAILRPLISS